MRRRWVSQIGTETVGGRIRRRLRAIRRRARGPADLAQIGDLGDLPFIGGIFIIIAVLAMTALVLVVLVPLLVLVIELTLLALLAAATFALRSVRRHPWVVEAVDDRGRALRWHAIGSRAARDRCREVAQHLEAGITPPDAEVIAEGHIEDPPALP